jgi:hypothetical protein
LHFVEIKKDRIKDPKQRLEIGLVKRETAEGRRLADLILEADSPTSGEVRQAIEQLDDQAAAARVIAGREGWLWYDCRQALLKKLTDEDALLLTALSHEDEVIAVQATSQIETEEGVIKAFKMLDRLTLRKALLKKIARQELLANLYPGERDPRIRRDIVLRLEDPAMIANIARTDEAPKVRRAAVLCLKDAVLLTKIAREDGDDSVQSAAQDILEKLGEPWEELYEGSAVQEKHEERVEWFRYTEKRGAPLPPSSIILDDLTIYDGENWITMISDDPHGIKAARIRLSNLSKTINQLRKSIRLRYELDDDAVVEILHRHLGAACPGCRGGLTGEMILTLATYQETPTIILSDTRVAKLMDGQCPFCSMKSYLLIWQG